MATLTPLLQDLARTLGFDRQQGFVATPLAGVRLFRANRPVARAPLFYDAGLVIIGQGCKIGYLDDRRFRYDADNYLILSVPMPFECETLASADEPLLGIFVDVDVEDLRGLVATVEDPGLPAMDLDHVRCGVEPAPLDAAMLDATARLLRCLLDPVDVRVLGPTIVRELTYRALRGPHGAALRALTLEQGAQARVARALAFAHRRYREPIRVDDLARQASMSPSAFHRAFKAVTGDSPLQYVKKMRLHEARRMLVHESVAVSSAAFEVGYESPAQFSRDFKRHFGATPSEARRTGYAFAAGS